MASRGVFVERLVVGHSERFNGGGRQFNSTTGSSRNKGRAPKRQTSKQRLTSREYNISLDVAALRQQLQQLQLHRSLLQTRALFTHRDGDGSAVKVAAEYWKLFRRGFRAEDPRQAAYLLSVTAEDMRLGSGLGRDELLHQWELYTDYFAIRRYEMESLQLVSSDDGSCIVRSTGVFFGAITLRALEVVFPIVLRDPMLTQQLLGRAFVVPIAITLHFNEDCKWSVHSGEADLFSGLSRLLGDAVQAARIVENAQVAEEGIVTAEVAGRPAESVERIAGVKRQRFRVEEEAEEEVAGGAQVVARESEGASSEDVADTAADTHDTARVAGCPASRERGSIAFLLS